MSRETDERHRDAAVRTHGQNVVVLASAGTGKTSLLVERLLNQVIEQQLPLTQVAAITFTEKAATEMRLRLARGLELLSKPEKLSGTKEEAARAWRFLRTMGQQEVGKRARLALRSLPLASISTIHGFCARVLRQQAHRIGLPVDFRVDEGFGYEEIKRAVWQEWIEGPEGPNGAQGELWLQALERLDLPEIRELGFALADCELHRPRAIAPLGHSREVFGERARAALDWIERSIAKGLPTDAGLGSYLETAGRVLGAFLDNGPDALRSVAEEHPYRSTRGQERSVLVGAPPKNRSYPDAGECARTAATLLGQLKTLDEEAIERAHQLLRPFARIARERAIRAGRLTFDALLSLTRNLLARQPSVRRELARRFRLILVDEFQDTDPLQYEIVFFLAEDPDTGPASDPFQTELAAGKLFIVGDPKQSIYGFRGADIAACQRAIRHIESQGGLHCSLTMTWRAVPEIVEPLDHLFRELFRPLPHEDSDLHPGYEGMVSGRPTQGEPRVQIWTIPPDEDTHAEEARRREARVIAHWIAEEWMRPGAVPVRGYGQVALLFRSFTQVHLYVQALRRWRIPFALERSQELLNEPEVQQLWAILRSIACPTHAPAVLGALRSVVGAASDAELARYAAEGNRSWCYADARPDPSRFPAIARTFDWLRRWHGRLGQTPLDRFVTELVEESLLIPLHASAVDGRARFATLRQVTGRVASLARDDPSWPLCRVLDAFETIEGRDSSTVGETGAATNVVRLLTFHAAKGLEFPVVFLPDLERPMKDPSGRRLRETRTGILDSPAGRWVRVGGLESPLSPLQADLERRRDEAEVRRLFYVACTRAMDHLILVRAPRAKRGPEPWAGLLSTWGSGDERDIGKGLAREPGVVHRVASPPEPSEVRGPPQQRRDWESIWTRAQQAAERARENARAPFRRPSGLREDEEARTEQCAEGESVPPVSDARNRLVLAVGLAVHQVLERWDFRDRKRLGDLIGAAAVQSARTKGVEPDSVRSETRDVIDRLMQSGLADYLASVEILGREVPFLLREDAESWSGTIDLIYRDREGALVVADYKTDREIRDETTGRYHEQLTVYARAVARAFPAESDPLREILYVREGKRLRC
jgi:ATP-dependent helicase/nuclease subunit A